MGHMFRLVVLYEFGPYLYWFLSRLVLLLSNTVPVNCIGGLVCLWLVWTGSNSRLLRDSNPEEGVPLHNIKSYMGRRDVAPLIHILSTRRRYRGRRFDIYMYSILEMSFQIAQYYIGRL